MTRLGHYRGALYLCVFTVCSLAVVCGIQGVLIRAQRAHVEIRVERLRGELATEQQARQDAERRAEFDSKFVRELQAQVDYYEMKYGKEEGILPGDGR